MELTLTSCKTDAFRKGVKLTIAASLDIACLVQAMQQFLARDTYGPPDAPLLCLRMTEQPACTREYVVDRLQGLAITAGLGHGAWNGHSLWRGAATWAAKIRMSETEIQILGRWRSDAYKAYIDYTDSERISLARQFQTTQTSQS